MARLDAEVAVTSNWLMPRAGIVSSAPGALRGASRWDIPVGPALRGCIAGSSSGLFCARRMVWTAAQGYDTLAWPVGAFSPVEACAGEGWFDGAACTRGACALALIVIGAGSSLAQLIAACAGGRPSFGLLVGVEVLAFRLGLMGFRPSFCSCHLLFRIGRLLGMFVAAARLCLAGNLDGAQGSRSAW